jgi:hypothetical protein
MRIVQTFWTAGRDPLKYAFGWSHPEYNLMSWALSCLSLREHYDEVALYTDQEGYDVLINKLHLPYTEVNVVYDKNLCLPHHWAYAKIKTYSMQTKPFIHVDGDVYLPHPIPEDIANAPLIAQNREIGTEYYRSIIDRLLIYPEIILPEYVQKGLSEQSVPSYNMGLFGGCDLDFIQRYCKEVEEFMSTNGMNDRSERVSRIDCNVFFEQILFAVFADSERREVASLLERPIHDKGYKAGDFCNLRNYMGNQLFHILGGHKRNAEVQKMLRHFFATKYSDLFVTIYELMKDGKQFKMPVLPAMSKPLDESIIRFFEFVEQKVKEWSKMDVNSYIEYETSFADFTSFEPDGDNITFRCNPYLCMYTFPDEHADGIAHLHRWLRCEEHFPLKTVAILPVLIADGYEIEPVLPIDVGIIEAVQHGGSNMNDIKKQIYISMNTDEIRSAYLKSYILEEMDRLIKREVIIFSRT